MTKEYAAAGAQKTQEIYNEYVAPNAAAGAEIVKVCIIDGIKLF